MRLLICSDGLTKELTAYGIRHFLVANAKPERAARQLVEAALGNGGRDNVTVVVVDVLKVVRPSTPDTVAAPTATSTDGCRGARGDAGDGCHGARAALHRTALRHPRPIYNGGHRAPPGFPGGAEASEALGGSWRGVCRPPRRPARIRLHPRPRLRRVRRRLPLRAEHAAPPGRRQGHAERGRQRPGPADVPGRGEPHGAAQRAPVDPHRLPGERRRPTAARTSSWSCAPRRSASATARERFPVAEVLRIAVRDRQRGRDRAPRGRAAPRHQALEHPAHRLRPSRALRLRHRRDARRGRDERGGRPVDPVVGARGAASTRPPARSRARSGRSARPSTRCSPAGRPFEIPGGDNVDVDLMSRIEQAQAAADRPRRRAAPASSGSSRAAMSQAAAGPPGQRARVRARAAGDRGPSSGCRRRRSRSRWTTGRSRPPATSTTAPASRPATPSPAARPDAGARADRDSGRRAPSSCRTRRPRRRHQRSPAHGAARRTRRAHLGHLGRRRRAHRRAGRRRRLRARAGHARGIPVVTDVQASRRRNVRDVHLARPGHRERRRLHRRPSTGRPRACSATPQFDVSDAGRRPGLHHRHRQPRRQDRRPEHREVRRRRRQGAGDARPASSAHTVAARDGGRDRRPSSRSSPAWPWSSGGYTAQRSTSATRAVWVVNAAARRSAARTPTCSSSTRSSRPAAPTAEVVQQGSTVLVLDQRPATVGIVDPATSTVTKSVAVPPDGHALAPRRGPRRRRRRHGELWIDARSTRSRTSTATPTRRSTFGAGAVTSVDPAGVLFAYSPVDGEVAPRRRGRRGDRRGEVAAPPVDGRRATCRSRRSASTGPCSTRPAARLCLDGPQVDLAGLIGPTDDPCCRLRRSTGGSVADRYRRGLLSVGLGGGEPVRARRRACRAPAAPLVARRLPVRRLEPATAWRRCAGERARSRSSSAEATGAGALDFARERRPRWCSTTRAAARPGRAATTTSSSTTGTTCSRRARRARRSSRTTETVPHDREEADAAGRRRRRLRRAARRSTLLPVLLNDYDPNGDVLVIDAGRRRAAARRTLDLVTSNQQLQLTLDDAASGAIAFSYTISDGRGGTAHARPSTVTVRDRRGELAARAAARTNHAVGRRAAGGSRRQVLGDWVDPDGDPFFLTSRRRRRARPAVVTSRTASSCSPTPAAAAPRKTVTLTVSDGRDERPAACSRSRCRRAGRRAASSPSPSSCSRPRARRSRSTRCAHVRGGTGTLRLNAVPAKPDVADRRPTSRRAPSGSRATSAHPLPRVHRDRRRPDRHRPRPHRRRPRRRTPTRRRSPCRRRSSSRRCSSQSTSTCSRPTSTRPAACSSSPASPTPPADDGGARRGARPARSCASRSRGRSTTGSTTFNYRISNGLAEAEGTITVVEIPQPAQCQPPIAAPDTVTVRVGDVIDIPVLDNDEHPDARRSRSRPTSLEDLPTGGLLFASGDRLRYLAPEEAGELHAAYRVAGPDGQSATARRAHLGARGGRRDQQRARAADR